MRSQVSNRDSHIELLEDALQEISSSYRAVVESSNRHLEQDGCGNYGVISSFDSSFSSLSSDSEDESIHIRKVGGNTSGPVVAAAESCAASRGASGRSRIPRIIPRIATDTTRTSKNTHLQRETAMSAAHLNEVRTRVECLNRRILEAQSLRREPVTTLKSAASPDGMQSERGSMSSNAEDGLASSAMSLQLLSQRSSTFTTSDHRGNDTRHY
mmetsp:Transcript_7841/g.13229  ORF Transcript_7841/g.13229 Transcript_7841/m.13229 type:complete len:213 (-) Transcript_7841:1237-1875(-)